MRKFLKQLGRKAIGFVKGLNGKKTAELLTQASRFIPYIGEPLHAGLAVNEPYIGKSISSFYDTIDNYLNKGKKKKLMIRNTNPLASTEIAKKS